MAKQYIISGAPSLPYLLCKIIRNIILTATKFAINYFYDIINSMRNVFFILLFFALAGCEKSAPDSRQNMGMDMATPSAPMKKSDEMEKPNESDVDPKEKSIPPTSLLDNTDTVSEYGTPPNPVPSPLSAVALAKADAPIAVKTVPARSVSVRPKTPTMPSPAAVASAKADSEPCRASEALTRMKTGEYACCPEGGEVCFSVCESGELLTKMSGGGYACCPTDGKVCYPIVK